MRTLFLIFHGFAEYNGISKKINSQVNALRQCQVPTDLCYIDIDKNGHRIRMINDRVLRDYGTGIRAKVKKRIEYGSLIHYIRQNEIGLVYMRYDHNANPFLIHMLRSIKKAGVRTVVEIPTWPYDQEYKGLEFSHQCKLWVDKCFRKQLARQVFRFVTFSGCERIWGVKTINISNGIDFERIPLKQKLYQVTDELHLIGVADIHAWHGFDRVIGGLANYYKTPRTIKIFFHIVGDGVASIMEGLRHSVSIAGLGDYVIFHGPKFGKDLDELFELADMGIASLARHRSRINSIKTLKNREYAARGIPFIFSEQDSDFDTMPYILKVPANDDPIAMEQLWEFRNNCRLTPVEIRASVAHLSWIKQMQQVLNEVMDS